MARIAIVGEGVIGVSTALAIQKKLPTSKLTVFSAGPFDSTCSYGPAGLFRIDNVHADKHKLLLYGLKTFAWLEELHKNYAGSETGVKLLSGYIQSDNRDTLEQQEKAFADVVYDFRWLTEREIRNQFVNPARYCIHFSAFATEGSKYVPFLKRQLKNVEFIQKEVLSLSELASSYDVIVNCAGLNAGKLAGDDDTTFPTRGIVLEVEAPWHKQFLYRDFDTFSIPKENVVAIGSVKQKGNCDRKSTETEAKEILDRYCKIHPAMAGVKVLNTWCHLRPSREGGIRVEKVEKSTSSGQKYVVVHNYGHGGGGFTLGWGAAERAAELVQEVVGKAKY